LVTQATQGDALLLLQSLAKFSWSVDEQQTRLDALRHLRPDVWQAWLAPALQRIETGNLVEAQALLGEAVERFPFTARFHYELARIAAMQHRVADAREAVRRALQLAPAWDWAIRLYVELALTEAAELESALTLLDSPLSRSEQSAECQVLRGKVLWRMGHREEAVQAIEQALYRWPDRQEAWQLAFAWMRELGEGDRLRRLANQVATRHPHGVHGWVRLVDCAATLEEALSAAARATEIEPFNQLAYLARLNALLRFQQFDAVREAVRDAPWGERSPTVIRRYKARSWWLQEKHDEAISAMRELLTDEPNDFHVWQELADWLNTTPRTEEYVAAAREMVRLSPGAAIAHGHLGHALRKRGETALAIYSMRTAFDLDPNYAFAGLALVDLLMETEWQLAEPVLHVLRQKCPGPATAFRELRFAIAGEAGADIAQPLRDIVRATQPQVDVFHETVKLLDKGLPKTVLLDAIRDACKTGEACEPAIYFWLGKEFDISHPQLLDQLEPYLQADHHHGLKIQLIATAVKFKQFGVVPRLVARYGTVLRANARTWGQVSYGLVTGEFFQRAIEWLHDWRRDDAQWWALDNLAIAMRNVGMHSIAHEVSLASHAKDPGKPDAMVWLAIDAALSDELDAMHAYLDKTEGYELRPFYRSMRDAVMAYREALDNGRTATLNRAFAKAREPSKRQVTLAWLMVQIRRKWMRRAGGWRRLARYLLLR
jgi:tetratricopeptide (TPR) repeat protein